ncbi:signal peptidase I [Leadbettera azotonutricia]|uniref:Signal peptidase I n=1 Tax=Leadbettera azotonutricia (strain ATCC BAA-888 / DSM 13862 / ZAS-9) TaxID=545695 RepID=F5YCV8_LEAAZ|nr:signal peptidase I [Leadbettera azotonutricia]AEF82119.1 signal peptidase I [Leadbettera azotonutricia ZAS-9]
MIREIDFFDRLQRATEVFLTARRREKRIKKEKQKAKNFVLDWLEAFLWAAGVVLLINQYLFQAYQIPSGSMIDTLLIGDRIFVNKIIYGPEILPGLGKLPSPVKPKRNDIIIFENPSYISRGTVFDVAQRIIYMLTLSFVDIDKDESGEPKAHFLIKRAVGTGGDWFVQDKGNLRIRFAGEDRWADENDFHDQRGMVHKISRLMDESAYPALEAAGKISAYNNLGLPVPGSLNAEAAPVNNIRYPDYIAHEKAWLEVLRAANPQDSRYRSRLARHTLGWYVPESRILPLGDNRDNSRDGRYFGPVKTSKILGKGSVIYYSWPQLGRIGPIR